LGHEVDYSPPFCTEVKSKVLLCLHGLFSSSGLHSWCATLRISFQEDWFILHIDPKSMVLSNLQCSHLFVVGLFCITVSSDNHYNSISSMQQCIFGLKCRSF
jgi:hypothetical protein